MNILRFNPAVDDKKRREFLFDGDFLFYSNKQSLKNLVEHAKKFVKKTFGELDPEKAQDSMAVNDFVELVSPLKSGFTNDAETKKLIRAVLVEFGCDVEKTYFDVPRIRIVTSNNYLTAGVGYAYKAHRDTWYSSPQSQINWWLPVFDLTPDNTMSLYPGYWKNPIKNSSKDFNYDEWCQKGRVLATSQTGVDTRKHPLPQEEIDVTTETRFVLSSAEAMIFSASQLHATAPNTSGKTRFSLDFRTIHLDDILEGRGAPNIDNDSTGTTLNDFFRASDLEKISPDIIDSFTNAIKN
jgi:phytanoyl-CoA dioxygenase PhyH